MLGNEEETAYTESDLPSATAVIDQQHQQTSANKSGEAVVQEFIVEGGENQQETRIELILNDDNTISEANGNTAVLLDGDSVPVVLASEEVSSVRILLCFEKNRFEFVIRPRTKQSPDVRKRGI